MLLKSSPHAIVPLIMFLKVSGLFFLAFWPSGEPGATLQGCRFFYDGVVSKVVTQTAHQLSNQMVYLPLVEESALFTVPSQGLLPAT